MVVPFGPLVAVTDAHPVEARVGVLPVWRHLKELRAHVPRALRTLPPWGKRRVLG